jgi:hypothetical protein
MLYEYFCEEKAHGGCGHVFEEHLSMNDRMIPLNKPCPKCKKVDTICRKMNMNLIHTVVNPKAKMDDNFKETMTRIHKEHKEAQSSWF